MTELSLPTYRFDLSADTLAARFLAVVERQETIDEELARHIIRELLTHVGILVIELKQAEFVGPRSDFLDGSGRATQRLQQENRFSGWTVCAANRKDQGATILLDELWQVAQWLMRDSAFRTKPVTDADAVGRLTAELERIAGFMPILLSPAGDFLTEYPDCSGDYSAGRYQTSEPDHLKDTAEITDWHAQAGSLSPLRHGPQCRGQIRIIPLTPERTVLKCDNCGLRQEIPCVETFGDLRREMATLLSQPS